MRTRLILFIKMYVFWILFFVVQKPLFMIWQYSLMGDIRPVDWLLVPWHGLPLDISVASYVAAAVGLILCISFWIPEKITKRLLDILTAICLTVGLWTILGDNGCFPSWGYHLSKDIFAYLASPREALACAPWWVWVLGLIGFAILFALWWWIYVQCTKNNVQRLNDTVQEPVGRRILSCLGMLLLSGALFLPMRGSVTASTMNTGRVYFSDNQMLNMAAVNPLFNIMESLGSGDFNVAKYTYMSTEEARNEVERLLPNNRFGQDGAPVLLTTSRPNVIVLILESFAKNAMDSGAMPRLSQIADEGVFFSNIFANSYRTDRGVVSVLSGYPGQPTSSLMVAPYKSQFLPQLGKSLLPLGYRLKFFYGGDEDFTNMRSFLVQGGFEDRVADRDFAPSDRLSKWGVPDHILFQHVTTDIMQRTDTQKHLDVILSLSSHEPFDVPYHHLENPYLNAVAYADSCVGAFVDSLRQSPLWDSTVVVMLADHGFPYPQELQNYMPARYRIPIIMTGGAVREHKQITRLGSQIDMIPTLLCQMGLPADDFVFGKNVADTTQQEFAFYAFNDGFGLIIPNDTIVLDAKADQVIIGTNPTLEHSARAFVQRVMEIIGQL